MNTHAIKFTSCVLVLSVACSKKNEVQSPKEVPLFVSESTFGTLEAPRDGIRPTALPTIDAAVVGRLIRVRLKKVVSRAMTDVLETNPTVSEQKPLRDFAATVVSLLFDVSDAEARSQAIAGALLRDGLSYGFAILGREGVIASGACTKFADLSNAAYEGLATTRYVGPLGFIAATGTVPQDCVAFAQSAASYADLFAVAGRTLSDLPLMRERVADVVRDCSPDALQELPADLLKALGKAERASAPLDYLRSLRQTWSNTELVIPDAAAKKPYVSCAASLDAFARTYDQVIAPLVADKALTATLSLEGLDQKLKMVEDLGTRVLFWVNLARTVAKQLTELQNATRTASLSGALQEYAKCSLSKNCSPEVVASVASLRGSIVSVLDRLWKGEYAKVLNRLLKSERVQQLADAAAKAIAHIESMRTLAEKLRVERVSDLADFELLVRVVEACAAQKSGDCHPDVAQFVGVLNAAIADIDVRLDDVARWTSALAPLQSITHALVTGRTLKRGDVVTLVASVRDAVSAIDTKSSGGSAAKRILVAVLDALPNAVREEADAPMGLRLDAPGLASAAVEGFQDDDAPAFHPIATVGAGYVLSAPPAMTDRALVATPFEEIGVGYRWPLAQGRLRLGPHLVTSGLLYQLTSSDITDRQVFVGGGLGLNVYKLIDISANVGAMVAVDNGDRNFAATLSLQLPLLDYLEALSSGDVSAEGTR